MADQTATRVGTTLEGRYRLLALIGEGSMGSVYLAERLGLARRVAVKFLRPDLARDPSFARRFDVETRALARLGHPNCVSVFDFGVDRAPYVVMELVEGESLRAVLRRGPLPPVRALGIARQLLAALAHAHGKGVVHRDVKPENIVLDAALGIAGDHVRVLDFGLSRLLDDTAHVSQNLMIGTPSYMAPEQLRPGLVDERADLYAAGLVLYEMLTGRNPFDAPSLDQTFLQQRQMPLPPPQSLCPGLEISAALEQLLRRALAKLPGERFAAALEMTAALEALPELAPAEAPPVEMQVVLEPDRLATLAAGLRGATARLRGALVPVAGGARGALAPMLPAARLATTRAAAGVRAAAALIKTRAWPEMRRRVVQAHRSLRPWLARMRALAGRVITHARVSAAWARAITRARVSAGRAPVPLRWLGVGGLAAFVVGVLLVMGTRVGARPAGVAADRSPPAGPSAPAAAAPAAPFGPVAPSVPSSAEIAGTMAREAFARQRFADGVATFRLAIRRDPRMRGDAALVDHVIAGLASDRLAPRAESFLRELGADAHPHLRDAARTHPSPRVRRRAQTLLPSTPPPSGRG